MIAGCSIRRAAGEDTGPVVSLLEPFVAPLYGARAAATLRVLVERELAETSGVRLVAVRGGRVCATGRVALGPGDRDALASALARELGRYRAARALARRRGHGVRIVAGEALIEDLVVAAESRRLGIGSALLHAMVEVADAAGCARVLLAVRADNPAGLALHRSSGFVEVDVTRRAPRGHMLLAREPHRG